MKVVVVVNGEETEVEAGEGALFSEVRAKALEQSRNTARPPEDWELRDVEGFLVDFNEKVPAEQGPHGAPVFFLTLALGAGG
jgi:hypothetical protein